MRRRPPARHTHARTRTHLLNHGASRLAEGVADDVDGSLALGLLLRGEGDVSHLLAGIKKAVLGSFAEDVLRRSHHDG